MQLTILVLITKFCLTLSFMYIHPRVYTQIRQLVTNENLPDEFDELLKTYKYEQFQFVQPFNETEVDEDFIMKLNLTEYMENIQNLTDDNWFEDIVIEY